MSKNKPNPYIKSPLNYTGGKYKILSEILPIFPDTTDTFVDLFAGGLNVGVNVNTTNLICNDRMPQLVEIHKTIYTTPTQTFISQIKNIIQQYNLSQTNAEGYYSLRTDYNQKPTSLKLFVLTCYAFNHQIRYNNNHEYNMPFGKNRSSYNPTIETNLKSFSEKLKKSKITFYSKDFTQISFNNLTPQSLVYADPPYLISTGSYNDGKRGFKDWQKQEEDQLLEILTQLDKNNIRFALSNVTQHKNQTNKTLLDWSKKYNVHKINKNYNNSSYHLKDRKSITEEVLITNY